MDYAVIRSGGKQYRVSPGDTVRLEKLAGEPGSTFAFEEVLLASGDGGIQVGKPLVSGMRVVGEIVRHERAKKILVFKKKRRKNYRRKQGPSAAPHGRPRDGLRARNGSVRPWRTKKVRAAAGTVATAPGSVGASRCSAARRAKAGHILVRQVGTKIHPGNNVGRGRDFTLFATIDGIVKYERVGKDRRRVSVYPPA